MSDLRESGSIEQDADVVILLHREDYYHRGETGLSGHQYGGAHHRQAAKRAHRHGQAGLP